VPISPGNPANRVILRLLARRSRNLRQDGLAQLTFGELALSEVARGGHAKRPRRYPQPSRSHSIRPSTYPDNQQVPEQVGARRPAIALRLNSLSLT
jgi:hypothetical protein